MLRLKAVFLLSAVAMLAALGCTAKKDGSVFVGKWAAPSKNFGEPPTITCQCPIEITKIGDAFHIAVEQNNCGDVCKAYEGPYTLQPDGSLKNQNQFEPIMVLFDEAKNQVAISSAHSGLQYLSKRE
ncbi:MAG TPA: hypothetical protein VF219_08210 [Vicinamibacterales bacterium]